MDIKTREPVSDEIRQKTVHDTAGRAVRQPVPVKELKKEFKSAARTGKTRETGENYASRQVAAKSKQLVIADVIKTRSVTRGIRSIKRLQQKVIIETDRRKKKQLKKDEDKKYFKGKSEKRGSGKDIKIKGGKVCDSGSETKHDTSEKGSKSQAVSKAAKNAAVSAFIQKQKGGENKNDAAQMLEQVLKQTLKSLVSSLVVGIVAVVVVLMLIMMVVMYNQDSVAAVGNNVYQVMDNDKNDNIHKFDRFDDIQIEMGVNSIVPAANNTYHDKLQEVINENVGKYEVLNYDNAEPDWGQIVEIYIALTLINNTTFSVTDREEFERLMWNMVYIKCEFTDTEPVVMTISSEMKSIEEVAAVYKIKAGELKYTVTLAAIYGKAIRSAVSQLEKFVPDE